MDHSDPMRIYQDNPAPLILVCLRQIIKEPASLSRYRLPSELGHLIAEVFRQYVLAVPVSNKPTSEFCNGFFRHFKHKNIPLDRIDFSGLPITEEFFLEFLEEYQNQLDEISISQCDLLSCNDLKRLNRLLKGKNEKHKSLIIGRTFSRMMEENKRISGERFFDEDLKLKKLVVHNLYSRSDAEFTISGQLSAILTPVMGETLKYLDLSMCTIGVGSALSYLRSLETLILYSCVMTYPEVIRMICFLHNIRNLDISRQALDSDGMNINREDPKLLDALVSSLPLLQRLDISGTNLVGGKDRYIPAFEARMNKPFEFLGLFHTDNDAAYRSCIPALTIAGEANESQMLNACEAYMNRPVQLTKALHDLYNFYKTITPSETFDDVERALDVVLPILTIHLNNEQMIIYTTAALWCIVKINVTSKNLNDAQVRRTITSRLLDAMNYHKKSKTILINGGLTLLFLPDIICEHSRVADISLHMCNDPDPRTQGFGTTLLNTLACQVGGDQKVYIGNLNAIETMIHIINTKIEERYEDEILETAWSTLWNITDETPENCDKFLKSGGMEAFEKCYGSFRDNKEVLRNMMGLLGNVAECKDLRVHFMERRYIERFYQLLSSRIDGIECSYNACGILAHLVGEGHDFWQKHLPRTCTRSQETPTSISEDRITLMSGMFEAIREWPLNSKRNINYRSFAPIMRLVDPKSESVSQYWALFALANLTRINPAKYCPMLLDPVDGVGGLTRVNNIGNDPNSQADVRNLAQVIDHQYWRFEAYQASGDSTLLLENCDLVDIKAVMSYRASPNPGDATSEMGESL